MFNLDHDIAALRKQFLADGVVSVPGFVNAEIAEQLRTDIMALPWEMAYVVNGKPAKLPVSQLKQLPVNERQALFQRVLTEASSKQYSFMYDTYMLITHYLQNTLASPLLRYYVETISSPAVLNFMRELTANNTIIKADAQASRYLPGHYLKTHDDSGVSFNQHRIAAYTLSFSKNWQADWGGMLHLQDDMLRVERSYMPEFGTLNVFAVPKQHFVSQVTNYCPEQRLSIVGWLRSDLN